MQRLNVRLSFRRFGRALAVTAAGLLLWTAGSMPATAQQSPMITIIGGPVRLSRGCNTFVVSAPPGTAWRTIANRVSDPTSVTGMWRYDNPSQRYQGVYFSNTTAPTDGATTTVAATFNIWACVSTGGSVS